MFTRLQPDSTFVGFAIKLLRSMVKHLPTLKVGCFACSAVGQPCGLAAGMDIYLRHSPEGKGAAGGTQGGDCWGSRFAGPISGGSHHHCISTRPEIQQQEQEW